MPACIAGCKVTYPFGICLDHLLLYTAGTDEGSSGSPIFKQDGRHLKIAGIHRAGHEKDWDGRGTKGYNYGSLFTKVFHSCFHNWHPEGDKPNVWKYT